MDRAADDGPAQAPGEAGGPAPEVPVATDPRSADAGLDGSPAGGGLHRAANGAARSPLAGGGQAAGAQGRATFRSVFAVGEFRAIWLAQLLSVAGDQLARVAITVLVYERTRSALLTALTYAVTFLPWILGGVGLAGLADRLPRREVMIACDLARMALVGLMAAVSLFGSALSLWGMVALVFLVTLLDSPFKSARSALIADILTGEKYVLGTAVTQITFQSGTVIGFAGGGLVVAALGSRIGLLADAATFGVSALLLAVWVRRRPAAAAAARRSQLSEMAAGMRLVFGAGTLRTLVCFAWLGAFYEVPLALAVPYAAHFRGLPTAVGAGLVFAATPFGTAVGVTIFGRFVPAARRTHWIGPMAVGACALLLASALGPPLGLALAVFMASGVFGAYQLAANAAFVATVPASRRGQAFGLANGGLQVTQGVWFIIAGAVAQTLSPAAAIAISGGLGAVLAIALTYRWRGNRLS